MINSLTFDIETIPDQRDGVYEAIRDAVRPPANYKKQESIDKWLAENADDQATHEYQKLALNGLTCEICSIAYAVDGGPDVATITRTAGDGVTELDLLYRFAGALQKHYVEWRVAPRPKFIGHNVLNFDLMILRQRCLINGVSLPWRLPVNARHGNDDVFDTMQAWAGWRGYVKLDELFDAFAPTWEGERKRIVGRYENVMQFDGSDVHSIFQSGDVQTLADYNALDVEKTLLIHNHMRGVTA